MRVFGLERLFGCFVIVGYSFPEERSRASNQGVFLIFTVFSGRRFFFSLPAPSPLPLTRPLWLALSPPLFEKFQHVAFASKLSPQGKRLHCRLWTTRQENRSKVSFTARTINKFCLERLFFLFAVRKCLKAFKSSVSLYQTWYSVRSLFQILQTCIN